MFVKKMAFLFAVLALILLVGCSPDLAQTPMGDKELQWQGYIKKNYPEWRPPQTIPPQGGSDTKAAAGDLGVVDAAKSDEDVTIVSDTVKSTQEPEPVPAREYIVQKNDNLWRVANKFYGDGRKYPKIKAANESVLKGSNTLRPGMKLVIPQL